MEHTKDGQRKTVPTTNYVAYSKHSRGIYVIAYIHMFLLHNVEAVYDSGSLPRHLDLGPRSVCFGWMGPVAVRASRTDVINLGVPARYRSIMMTMPTGIRQQPLFLRAWGNELHRPSAAAVSFPVHSDTTVARCPLARSSIV